MTATNFFAGPDKIFDHFKVPVDIRLWDGKPIFKSESPLIKLTIRSPRALTALVKPTMGKLARHYVEQDLDVEGTAREIVRIAATVSEPVSSWSFSRSLASRLRGWFAHSRSADAQSIQSHYDVSNEFYGLWLDAQRVYSCAYFRNADDTLDRAQEQKLDLICRKLRLAPGERFLDIGCGWGALILWAARHYNVDATGVTLSQNQYEFAEQRIREAGLQHRCRVELLDYRDVSEATPFDKIASVGMFEHVGTGNLPVYFAKIFRLLKPGGLVLNHGITLGALDRRELASDIGRFIDDYVFPGGELTHVSHVIEEIARQELECADVDCLRMHYAKTLWHWVDRLDAKRDDALAEVGEKMFRIWRIYMAGSAYAFERGWLSIFQVLAGKPRENGVAPWPLTREDVYRSAAAPGAVKSAA